MAGGLIKIRDTDLTEYENLLLFRDELNKEALHYEAEYTRVFGSLVLKLFKLKIECIKFKKSIEFCERIRNRGQSVNPRELQDFLDHEMAAFNQELEHLKRKNEIARNAKAITEFDLIQIKRIYHKLAKSLHPDINPAFAKSKELKELWIRICSAYKANDLPLLKELEILVNRAMDGKRNIDFAIPDIANRIISVKEEIREIENTDPYQYKFILNDPNIVKEKKKILKEEIGNFENHRKELEDLYNSLGISKTKSRRVTKWVVN